MRQIPYGTLTHLIVGPAIDDTDGKTPETAVVVESVDVDLLFPDSLVSITPTSNAVNSLSHIAQGQYRLQVESSNAVTYGWGRIQLVIAGSLPWWEDIEVVDASVITAKQAGTYIQTQCSAALAAYDAPTDTEMDTRLDTLSGAIGGIVDTSLATYDGPTDTEMDGRLDTLSAHVDTGHAALPQTSDVNAQVLDVVNVDTFSEPGQGAPSATPTFRQMAHYLYKSWRNKGTTLSNVVNVFADDGSTVDQKSTISDDGTTFTKGEMESGA